MFKPAIAGMGSEMAEERLKTIIRVQAALRQGSALGRPGMVLHKGDADAGGVLVLLRGREGLIVLSQTRDRGGALAWLRALGDKPLDEASIDAYVGKQRRFDPDLWVIEFEAPDYCPPFAANIL